MQIPYFILTSKSVFLGNMLCSILSSHPVELQDRDEKKLTGTMPISNTSSSRESVFQKVAY